jgi:diguanylate cyclase (GGDEF)-like protein
MTRSLARFVLPYAAVAALLLALAGLCTFLFLDPPLPDLLDPLLKDFTGRYFFLVFALAALGLVAVFVALYRRLFSALRHDLGSLLRMLEDVRGGRMRVSYPMELREFAAVEELLRQSGMELVEEREQLKDIGLIDHLSRLSNRRHFEMRLKELFERQRTHGPSSLLLIDLDHFKKVNDRLGHDAGDVLIAGFARALRRSVRKTDFIARLGGDEFCVLYPHNDLDNAAIFVARLRQELPAELPLPRGWHELRWTAGLSVTAETDVKFDDVLWRADQALFRAKEAGRNTTRIFDPATSPQPRSLAANS